MRWAFPALLLALAACAAPREMGWVRPDGKPITDAQFELDATGCRGEMQKSNLSSTAEASVARGRAVGEVFTGCMAQHGYVQRPR